MCFSPPVRNDPKKTAHKQNFATHPVPGQSREFVYVHVFFQDGAFLLTVGSFLLKVELFYLQLTSLVILLTVGVFLLTALAFLLAVGAFLLSGKARLIRALRD